MRYLCHKVDETKTYLEGGEQRVVIMVKSHWGNMNSFVNFKVMIESLTMICVFKDSARAILFIKMFLWGQMNESEVIFVKQPMVTIKKS